MEHIEGVEFDHPFTVDTDGTVTDAEGIYAPEVYHSETTDIEIMSDEWEAFSVGYTGQHGYNGAVMHASEQLSGGLVRDILSTPGTYVVCAVEVMRDDENEDPFPAGWTVLRYKDSGVDKPDHVCVLRETPDGYGCATCMYS